MIVQLIPYLAVFWLGGVIGGAAIALANDSQKGHTVAAGLSILAVWPLVLVVVGLYLFFGRTLGSCGRAD